MRFGVKSGADGFFFPHDITEEMLHKLDARDFKERYGIAPKDTDKLRIVLAGDDSAHVIESKFLEPVIFNSMELDSTEVRPSQLKRKIFLTTLPKEKLKGTYALKYIQWGESEGFNERPTCSNRHLWYALSIPNRGDALWMMTQRYRFFVPFNSQKLICNKRLFNVTAGEGIDPKILSAILNSTVSALARYCFGRIQGGDAVMETEVVDVKMMLVPDPRNASKKVQNRIGEAFDSMCSREVLRLVEVDSNEAGWTGELALDDRQQLDDAVLELIGIADKRERERLRDELYSEITDLYRRLRTTERRMQQFRSATSRQGRASAQSIASEIWESLETPFIYRTPNDFIPKGTRTEKFDLPAGRARIVKGNMFQPDSVQVGEFMLELGDPVRCEFVKKLSDVGIHGEISVPIQSERCRSALDDYQEYVDQINEEFVGLAATYTAEEVMQERVVKELWRKMKA